MKSRPECPIFSSFYPPDKFPRCGTVPRSLHQSAGYWNISPPTGEMNRPLPNSHAAVPVIALSERAHSLQVRPLDTVAPAFYMRGSLVLHYLVFQRFARSETSLKRSRLFLRRRGLRTSLLYRVGKRQRPRPLRAK